MIYSWSYILYDDVGKTQTTIRYKLSAQNSVINTKTSTQKMHVSHWYLLTSVLLFKYIWASKRHLEWAFIKLLLSTALLSSSTGTVLKQNTDFSLQCNVIVESDFP